MTIQKQGMLRVTFVLFQVITWALPFLTAGLVSSWWGFAPLLLVFLSFAASILALGARMERRFGGGWAGVFLYSSLVLCASAMTLGHLGLLHATLVFASVAVIGAWMVPELLRERLWNLGRSSKRPMLWVSILFSLALFIRAFSAFLPQGHGDPLLYHLVGPKLWVDMGAAKLHPDLPIALLASSWEYLYVWPQVLWRGVAGEHRLIAAQIFSQWTHLLWGWAGTGLVLYRLLCDREHRHSYVAAAVGAALFVASAQWPGGLAKNDCGITFWAFGALLCLRNGLRSGSRVGFLFAGLFVGLAVIGKLNAGLVLAAGSFLLAQDIIGAWRRQDRSLFVNGALVGVIGFSVAVAPILWRNYVETKNPLYPMFPHFFPSSWVTESWAQHFSSVHPKQGFDRVDHLLYRLHQLPGDSPFFFGWLAMPFLAVFPSGRSWLKNFLPWIFFSAAASALFVLGFNHEAELRYLAGGLMAAAAVGALALLHVLDALAAKAPSARNFPVIFIFVGILAASKLPTHLLWKARYIEPGPAFLRSHTAGDSKAWIREHARDDELVIMVADNESYYLSSKRVTVLTERPDLDRATLGKTDLGDFLRGVCSVPGASYLLDARPQVGLLQRFPELARYEAALAFRGGASAVYDLRKLDRMIAGRRPYGCASSK